MSAGARGGTSNRPARSAWAPLRHRGFRAAWLTFLGVQVVTWSQAVGAVEVLAAQTTSVTLLALVHSASTAPAVLLSLPAGAAADLIDRRRVLILVVAAMAAALALLAGLVAAGAAPPLVVLALTVVMGAGIAVAIPSFAALIPDLVPREDLAAGVTLGGISINLARAAGPALAGLALAVTGAATLFAALAAALVALVLVLVRAPRTGGPPAAPASTVRAAIAGGVRFARGSPALRAVLARGGAYVLPATAMWAVLPAVAVQRLGIDAAGFGGMLAAVGVGAVLGAQALPALRARLSLDRLVLGGSVCVAATLVVLALVDVTAVIVAALVAGGAAWIAVVSSLNTAAQLAAPAWVRGRALSLNHLVMSGGMAAGSAVWGLLADAAGLREALLCAAVLLLVSPLAALRWPLARAGAAA